MGSEQNSLIRNLKAISSSRHEYKLVEAIKSVENLALAAFL